MRTFGHIAAATLVAVAGCESPQQVVNQPLDLPGTSNAENSAILARDVLNSIVMVDQGKDPACDSRALTDIRIEEDVKGGEFNPAGNLVKGEWLEVWTIDRCGSPISYEVLFVADGSGGTYFGIGTC